MQALLSIAVLPLIPSKNLSSIAGFPSNSSISLSRRSNPIKATAVAYDNSVVDYSSALSVFPAEACEIIGGDACRAIICPEVKLQAADKNGAGRVADALEEVEREYLEYADAKTVFLGEACDDLGGEFCGIEFQTGVF